MRLILTLLIGTILTWTAIGYSAARDRFEGKVAKVVDGDTIKATISIRIADINSPEMNTQAGKDAKKYVEGILSTGQRVMIQPLDVDRYSRLVARVYIPGETDLGAQVVKADHAVPVEWKSKRLWED